MAKRRVKLLAARPIDDELLMSGSVVELPEQQAKQLESQGRAVWAPGAELSPRASKARHRRLNDRATRSATEGGDEAAGASKKKASKKKASKKKASKKKASKKGAGGPININEATAEQLAEAISGVGEATAGDIIAWRKKLDGFKSLEQVAEVGGVSLEQLEAADVTV